MSMLKHFSSTGRFDNPCPKCGSTLITGHVEDLSPYVLQDSIIKLNKLYVCICGNEYEISNLAVEVMR